MKKIKKDFEITCNKAGHMKRKFARNKQGEDNVSNIQRDQSGRWTSDQNSGALSYDTVPWEAVLTLANHSKDTGSFYLSRRISNED